MAATPESPIAAANPDQVTTPQIRILPATKDDIETLGAILSISHGTELQMAFFFPGWPDTAAMVPYYTGRVAGALEKADEESVFKAVLVGNGDGIVRDGHEEKGKMEDGEVIVGVVRMTLQSGEEVLDRNVLVRESHDSKVAEDGEAKEEVKLADIPGLPKGVNVAFVGEVMKGIASLDKVMVGRKHYMLSSLAVLPAYQGRGFGTSLIQYCNTLADTARLPTYLTAFPGAYSLYCKMDYEEVKHFDVDLNAWSKKKWTGFGIYRSYGMVREVGGLGRDASSRKMLSGKFTT